ncbi:MAG: outer membrane protein assembly factor BamA [Thermodesulfobacteriota bacterium]
MKRAGSSPRIAAALVIAIALSFVFPGWAQDKPDGTVARIMLFPFTVNADNDVGLSLTAGLDTVLTDRLADYGTAVISDVQARQPGLSVGQRRRLALEKGAGAALWGSVTVQGEQFSIEASLTKTPADAVIQHFTGEGKSLSRAVENLAKNIFGTISGKILVSDIQVRGNVRIEAEAIKKVIGTKAGDAFSKEQLSDDLRSIYQMGYFEDVRVSVDDTAAGKIVYFDVKERPTVRKILFKDNTLFDDEELTKEITISRGSIINTLEIQRNIRKMEQLYKDKNYHSVKITYAILPEDNNQADIEFTIAQGDKYRIRKITFEGNKVYSDKQLKKVIETSEKGLIMWMISSAGDLKMDQLYQDVARLTAHYQDHGYMNAKIGDPEITYGDVPGTETGEKKKKGITITFKIEEGHQYNIGKIRISGDLIDDEQVLRSKLTIAENTVFNRSGVRTDLMTLSDFYSDKGYYYVDVYPETVTSEADRTVDIDYKISKGNLVYFDEIIISGNSKTRDKVIRRELDIYEQELYSGQKLKRGIGRLYRLNYFENVNVDTIEKEAENKVDLKIEVEEKSTGEFSFGGGYGSIEKFFATASISQYNLFGRGQVLQVQGQVGGTTTQYKLSFTEPWLFDIPLSAGFDLYNWGVDYDTYDMDTTGGGLRFGYPVFKDTRLYLSNTYEQNHLTDVSVFAPISIQEMEEDSITSSVSASLVYDTRDNTMNPRKGAKNSFTIENAGGMLGGDVAFTKYTTELGWYVPLFWKTFTFLHSEGGYVHENSGGYLPDYECFYLGGINSLRGFDWRDICVYETDETGLVIEKGGDKYVQFNLELLCPLFGEKIGLVGLLFYDTGNVYDVGESIDLGNLRETAGFGIRWFSPMGPIRLERGYILDAKDGEDSSGRWEFSIGTAF